MLVVWNHRDAPPLAGSSAGRNCWGHCFPTGGWFVGGCLELLLFIHKLYIFIVMISLQLIATNIYFNS